MPRATIKTQGVTFTIDVSDAPVTWLTDDEGESLGPRLMIRVLCDSMPPGEHQIGETSVPVPDARKEIAA